ncbi:MAG: peptidylprolyl isomerase [Planctomycetota bacterium]
MNTKPESPETQPGSHPTHESDLPTWATWFRENVKLVVAAIVVVGLIVVAIVYFSGQNERQRNAYWAKIDQVQIDRYEKLMADPDAEIDPASMAQVVEGTDAGTATPWGLMMLVRDYISKENWDQAQRTLEKIQSDYPSHWLNQVTDQLGRVELSPGTSIVGRYLDLVKSQSGWAERDDLVTKNPEPDIPVRAVLETSAGDIVLGFHSGQAPNHVSNFVSKALAGFYDGLAFQDVSAFSLTVGDPETQESSEDENESDEDESQDKGSQDESQSQDEDSQDEAPSQDENESQDEGSKDESEKEDESKDEEAPETILWEPSKLYQFEGAVSQVRPNTLGSSEKDLAKQSAELFEIFLMPGHQDEDTRTVFATVVSGLDVAKKIAEGEKSSENPGKLKDEVRIKSIRFEGGDPKTLIVK